jgi:hypothetical protein
MSNNNGGMSFKRGRMKNDVIKMKKKILILCSVLISMLIFIPVVLAAETTGTAAVSGNPALSLDLQMSGAGSLDGMTVGDNFNATSNAVNATVITNAPWTIVVSDAEARSTAAGFMAEHDGVNYVGTKVLTNALKIGMTSATPITLSNSPQTLSSGVAGITYNYPYFKQTIGALDTRVVTGHSYRIVTTFTASPL